MKKFRELYAIAVMVCAFFLCTCLPAEAEKSDCYGGRWELVESIQDTWTIPGNQGYFYYGTGGFWFWEKPTLCTSIALDAEGFMIEYSKSLVCIPPSQILHIVAPREYDCFIAGRAKVQDYYAKHSDDPCLYFNGMYHSDYGNLTTAYNLKKYKRICPSESFPQNANLGPGDGCL